MLILCLECKGNADLVAKLKLCLVTKLDKLIDNFKRD